ncbi:MAG: pyridoxal 5'-phosphate synthase glutaminase subunit PdxT [Bacillota bacterium]|nr:pyridoxal 5'-phosphate synthase glutaminase subunit PdxT [Bacillota bacterium]
MKIGVLSLQGGVIEHLKHIQALGHEAIEVKRAEELKGLDGIILPGGESTTIGKLLRDTKIIEPLRNRILEGMPTWGTCAGMILLANNLENWNERYLQTIDITVRRNAYGSQIDSFETKVIIPEVSQHEIPLVFIRAPFITHLGKDVKSLCELDGNVVAARQGKILVTSFHPELADNLEFHRYFLKICEN